MLTFHGYGSKSPTLDAAFAANVLDLGKKCNFLNTFRSRASYNMMELPVFSKDQIAFANKIHDSNFGYQILKDALSSFIYYIMIESSCSRITWRLGRLNKADQLQEKFW